MIAYDLTDEQATRILKSVANDARNNNGKADIRYLLSVGVRDALKKHYNMARIDHAPLFHAFVKHVSKLGVRV